MPSKSLKELGIRTYEPKKKIKINKDQTIPLINYVGSKLMHTGGFTSFFTSLGFGTLRGFFIAKKKIREIQMKTEKVLDLRKHPRRRYILEKDSGFKY